MSLSQLSSEVKVKTIAPSARTETLAGKQNSLDKTAADKIKSIAPTPEEAEVVLRILQALAHLEYGSVEIIVQDSKVVQIERTQRSRFSQPLQIPRV